MESKCHLCPSATEYQCSCSVPQIYLCNVHLRDHFDSNPNADHKIIVYKLSDEKINKVSKEKLLKRVKKMIETTKHHKNSIIEHAKSSIIQINKFS